MTDGLSDGPAQPQPCALRREHVLPTGQMHIVLRLGGEPLRLFNGGNDHSGRSVGDALVGGARDTFYVRDVSGPLCSVGAQLRPGAAQWLFGVPASALTGHHTSLADLWGASADDLRDTLLRLPPSQRLSAFEAALCARLPRGPIDNTVVDHALARFGRGAGIRQVVEECGRSHRAFIDDFRRVVGLSPKVYCRVLRFQRALGLLETRTMATHDVALESGYSDQAHFSRDFREFAGTTPGAYLGAAPRFRNHLPVAQRRSTAGQFRSRP